MTATTLNPAPARPALPVVTQKRVILSEWIKLRSLRSTMFSLLAALVCTIGLGLLISYLRAHQIETNNGFHPGPDFDAGHRVGLIAI